MQGSQVSVDLLVAGEIPAGTLAALVNDNFFARALDLHLRVFVYLVSNLGLVKLEQAADEAVDDNANGCALISGYSLRPETTHGLEWAAEQKRLNQLRRRQEWEEACRKDSTLADPRWKALKGQLAAEVRKDKQRNGPGLITRVCNWLSGDGTTYVKPAAITPQ